MPFAHAVRGTAELRAEIEEGRLHPGQIATVDELSCEGVSVGTAHRAVALLKAEGLFEAQCGRRSVVTADRARSRH